MPAGKLVFSGIEFVKSSRGGSSVRISVWRGTKTGGSTVEKKRQKLQLFCFFFFMQLSVLRSTNKIHNLSLAFNELCRWQPDDER